MPARYLIDNANALALQLLPNQVPLVRLQKEDDREVILHQTVLCGTGNFTGCINTNNHQSTLGTTDVDYRLAKRLNELAGDHSRLATYNSPSTVSIAGGQLLNDPDATGWRGAYPCTLKRYTNAYTSGNARLVQGPQVHGSVDGLTDEVLAYRGDKRIAGQGSTELQRRGVDLRAALVLQNDGVWRQSFVRGFSTASNEDCETADRLAAEWLESIKAEEDTHDFTHSTVGAVHQALYGRLGKMTESMESYIQSAETDESRGKSWRSWIKV
ncbi:uncharacterized protein MKK02DRAFT_41747 [Dioszegia hungarica]|uniref:Uncharacterized protein n=1 Tax=Dioszegia hungarica TaxID=4972 RepID=A0AA38HG83_9TREE|nr:uncharacterized protein MKK02DRAFT_41747 [Dioszegia hungarica]KAI9638726.1 hypothetical protein MKK02DRAFT_41747 [Dioszegia hungarica]